MEGWNFQVNVNSQYFIITTILLRSTHQYNIQLIYNSLTCNQHLKIISFHNTNNQFSILLHILFFTLSNQLEINYAFITSSNIVYYTHFMKASTLIFFAENGLETFIYRLPTNPLVPTDECYSNSVLLSMAAYMVWKFPHLIPPGINTTFLPKYREKTFPDRLAMTHPMYDYWVQLLLQNVCVGNALRKDQTLYFRIKIDFNYVKLLKLNGFSQHKVLGKLSWKDVQQQLDEENLRQNQKEKLVLLITCTVLLPNKVSFSAPAILAGLYFNNQNWKTFRVMNGEYPSHEDYEKATQIIIPGSPLCISINIEPNIQKLINQLRSLVMKNQKVKFLGICYGHQLLSEVFNPGSVRRAKKGSFGLNKIQFIQSQTTEKYKFLKGISSMNLCEVHNDEVYQVPYGFTRVAQSSDCAVQMMISNDGRILTMQFHPDYTLSRYRSIVALNKSSRNQIQQHQILQIIAKEHEMQDQSFTGQQMVRQFLCQ